MAEQEKNDQDIEMPAQADGKEQVLNTSEAQEPQQPAAPDPAQKIAALEEELAKVKDQLLRQVAEYDNFRKRMQRDKEESLKFANTSLIVDLITIIDDFERAIKSSEDSKDFTQFHEGVAMIEKRFANMLESKYGLTRFESAGQAFDPNKHEAVMMEPSDQHDTPTVLVDFQKGYYLHDRVVRPARVKVSQPSGPLNDTKETQKKQ